MIMVIMITKYAMITYIINVAINQSPENNHNNNANTDGGGNEYNDVIVIIITITAKSFLFIIY